MRTALFAESMRQYTKAVKTNPEMDFFVVAKSVCTPQMAIDGPLTCFSALIRLGAYVAKLSLSTPNVPTITWDDKFLNVQHNNIVLNIPSVRVGLQEALAITQSTIASICHGHDLSSMGDLALLKDNMSDTRIGWGYMDGVEGVTPDALLNTILDHDTAGLAIRHARDQVLVSQPKAIEIVNKCATVNELLGFLIHVTGGAPARGTEVADIRIRNQERLRNVHKSFGKTFIIHNYTKTTNNTQSDSFLPHQLPDLVALLLDYYLIFIRPLEIYLTTLLWGADRAAPLKEFLYVRNGVKITSTAWGSSFGQLCHIYLNCNGNMTLLDYRHLATAIKREYVDSFYWNHQANGDEIGDLQAGHSSHTAELIYARDTNAPVNMNTQMMLMSAQFCRQWHNVLGVGLGKLALPLQLKHGPAHVTNLFTTDAPYTDRVLPEPTTSGAASIASSDLNPIIQAVTLQMSQLFQVQLAEMEAKIIAATATAVGIALAEMKQMPLSVPLQQPMPPPLSRTRPPSFSTLPSYPNQQSTFISLPSSSVLPSLDDLDDSNVSFGSPLLPATSAPTLVPNHDIEELPSITSIGNKTDCDTALEEMSMTYLKKGTGLEWKSEGQKKLVMFTKYSGENLVAILPTGGGKSAAYEVASSTFNRHRVIVVICPFRILVEQGVLANNLRKPGIAIHWENGRTVKAANSPPLVYVSADVAVSNTFGG